MSVDLEKMKMFGVVTFLILAIQLSCSEPVINVQGHYVVTNYAKDQPRTNQIRIGFVATLGENAWKICATNQQDPKVWEVLTYDGTNTYLLMPYRGHFAAPKGDSSLFGIVNAGAHYNMPSISYVEIFCPWMVYCLPPQDISSDMPWPWSNHTRSLFAYGYRWNVTPSAARRFIEAFTVVRDTSLDLSDKDEFLRPTFEYPQTLEDFDVQQSQLAARKAIPNGLVEAEYTCREWYETNNLTIPANVEFRRNRYVTGIQSTNSWAMITIALKADQITVKEDTIKVPALIEVAYVRDFRYTQRNESRMYPFAEYTQSGGWKSGNDQELLAQRDYYMKHGPKYGSFDFWGGLFKFVETGNGRLIFAWSLLALTQVVAIAILVRMKVKTKNQ